MQTTLARTKTTLTDDAAPDATTLASEFYPLPPCWDGQARQPTGSVAVIVEFVGGTSPDATTATLTVHLRSLGESSLRKQCVALPSIPGVGQRKLVRVPLLGLASGSEVYAQLTSIALGAPASIKVHMAPDAPMPHEPNARPAITETAYVASKVLLAGPGVLKKASCLIDPALADGSYYVCVLNAPSLPVDGAVTHLLTPWPLTHVAGLQDGPIDWNEDIPDEGIIASAGAVMVISTTCPTLTKVATAHFLPAGA